MRERGHVGAEAIAAMRDAGFSAEQVLETLTMVAFATLATFVANVGRPPVDDAFAAQAWEVVSAA